MPSFAAAEPTGAPAPLIRQGPEPHRARGARGAWVPGRVPIALQGLHAADPLPAMLDAVYDAALAPARWPDALAALAAGLGGNAATLHCGRAAAPPSITAAFGVGNAAMRGYRDRYAALDPLASAAAVDAAWAGPVTAREATAAADLERTEFFADWMRPNGFDDALCLALLPPETAHRAGLRVSRPPNAPRFGPAERAVLARLAPHLRRAAEMHRRLSAAAAAAPAGPLAEALDRLAAGVALLDAGGVVHWANRAADGLLRCGDGLSLDRGGALRADSSTATEALRRLVGAASAGMEGAMPLPRPSGRPALALRAVPLPARPAAAGREGEPVLPAPAAARPTVLLLLSDPAEGGAPDAALQRRLRAIYGLTAAEAAVAARAARGVGMPEVAQSLGLGVATARTHAQRVFSKAGVRGQAELALRVERLSLLRGAEHPERAAAPAVRRVTAGGGRTG